MKALRYGNKEQWFQKMVDIGPCLTTNPQEAARFENEAEAFKCPALDHPVCGLMLEVTDHPAQQLEPITE